MNLGDPIFLTGNTGSLARGGIAAVSELQLRNPSKEAVLIDEFRFALQDTSGSMMSGIILGVLVELGLGQRTQITDGFIPISMLRAGHQALDAQHTTSYYTTWKLPKAMFLPPGARITARFKYAGSLDAANDPASLTDVYIAAVGRVFTTGGPLPTAVDLPYAAQFTPADSYDPNTVYNIKSGDGDLRNPFNVPLQLQQFNGRILYDARRTDFYTEVQLSPYIDVRLYDSSGFALVRDPTKFSHLFQVGPGGWVVKNITLAPGKFFTVYIDTTAAALPITAYRPYVSMLGHRTIARSAVEFA